MKIDEDDFIDKMNGRLRMLADATFIMAQLSFWGGLYDIWTQLATVFRSVDFGGAVWIFFVVVFAQVGMFIMYRRMVAESKTRGRLR